MIAEVWDLPSHQQRFMEQRLGPALHEAGVSPPTRTVSGDVVARHRLS